MTYRLQGVFTAIADPHRRQILDCLAIRAMSAGALAARFDISRPAVARHLRVLEDTGLVEITRHGRHRMHRLNPEPLAVVRQWLGVYDRFWDDKLLALKAQVEGDATGRK